MPTALVLGVNGQDGSLLAEALLKRGYQVTGAAARRAYLHRAHLHRASSMNPISDIAEPLRPASPH